MPWIIHPSWFEALKGTPDEGFLKQCVPSEKIPRDYPMIFVPTEWGDLMADVEAERQKTFKKG